MVRRIVVGLVVLTVAACGGQAKKEPAALSPPQQETTAAPASPQQSAAPVDDIGIAALADLQRGDDIPDQLQIDLGDGDTGIPAVARHRQGHVRLGFLAEIDRAEPDALRLRFGKAR